MLFGAVFLFWMGRCRCRESPQKRWDCFVKKDSRKAVLFSAEVMIRTLPYPASRFGRALAEKKAWPSEFSKNSGQRIFTALPLEKSPSLYRQVCAERNGKSIEIKILFGNPVILKSFEQKRTVAHLDPLEPD